MKGQQCFLVLHGATKEIDGGVFPTITAAKNWVKECWDRPYTIRPIIHKGKGKGKKLDSLQHIDGKIVLTYK